MAKDIINDTPSWEVVKENYAPVKSGRAAKAISEVVTLSEDSANKHSVDNKRRELLVEVRDYKGDDPMEPWVKFVKWSQEHLCKSELQRTLETCTKELTNMPRYTADVRLLRLWIQLADCISDPTDIFAHLREKKIGIEYALFYEAHATYYELKGNFSAAESSFTEGIERNARPLERLKQKSMAFQKRMAQRIQRKVQEDSLGMNSSVPVRSSLSILGAQPVPSNLNSNLPNARPSILGVANQRPQSILSQRSGLFQASTQMKPQISLITPVAVDEEFGHATTQASIPQRLALGPPPLLSALGAPQNSSKELKPFNLTRKENNEKPGPWTAAPLAQVSAPNALQSLLHPTLGRGAVATTNTKASLDICIDDEFEEDAHLLLPVAPPPPPKASGIGLRQRVESPSADPKAHPPLPLPPSLPSLLSTSALPTKKPNFHQAPAVPSLPHPQSDVTVSTRAAFDILNDLFTTEEGVGRGTKRPASSASMLPPPPRPPPESTATINFKRMAADVTVNTRAAFDILNDLFSDDLPHEEERPKQRKGMNGLAISDRAALANQASRQSAATFALHEDTDLVARAPTFTSVPPIYEDTIDVGHIPSQSGPSSSELLMYEDTQFLPGIKL